LPTRKELKTLYQKDTGTHNMTPLLKTIETWVWSDETKGLSSAWFFNFLNDIEDWFFRDCLSTRRGFAVRFRR
jgi:hypothetical protein